MSHRRFLIGYFASPILLIAHVALAGNGHAWGKAPEIDPSLMGSGLAVLAGGLLLVVERVRARRR